MWIWDDSAGTLTRNGRIISRGYAGKGRGKNNPALIGKIGIGPPPPGLWKIGPVASDNHTGPFSILLSPEPGTDTLGRSGFRIHGDSISDPGNASRGCIILPRSIRNAIIASGDDLLQVVL